MTQEQPNPFQQPQQQTYTNPQPKSSGGCLKYGLIGCGAVLVLSILVCSIGGFFAYKNARSLGANAMNKVARTMVDSSTLPDDQKARIGSQLDRVTDAFKDKKLNLDQMGQLFQEIEATPILSIGMVYFAESQYINPSNLTDAEKADAKLQLQRLSRGIYEETIAKEELSALTDPFMEERANGDKRLKQTLTDAELRDLISKTRQLVESKGIPNEPYQVDLATEVENLVNKFMQKVEAGELGEMGE